MSTTLTRLRPRSRGSAPPVAGGPPGPDAVPTLSLARDGARGLRDAVAARTPVVVTDLAADWPALERWTPAALAEHHGHRPVRVYDADFGAPGRGYMDSVATIPFGRFLSETLGEGRDLRMFLYNLGRQIPELLDDIVLPDFGPRFSRHFVYAFFGCRGATTPLHFDIDMGDVLHTVIHGRRRIRLFAPADSRALYQHPFTVRSYVDLDAPDAVRHPALALADGREVVLEAGSTLFMPAGWWHEFHYLDAGMGVSLRAPSPRLSDRAAGLANLLVRSPIDRLANRIAPRRWYEWKQATADARARSLLAAEEKP